MKQVKQKKWGRLIVGGAVCAVLGVNALIFPGILEGLTNAVKLQTVQAEDLPKEKEMTVFDRMQVSKVPIKLAEPDVNAISKEKAIDAATTAHAKTLEEYKKRLEKSKKEAEEQIELAKKELAKGVDVKGARATIKTNQEIVDEIESVNWSLFESAQKDIKYVEENGSGTKSMWVVSFEDSYGTDDIIPKEEWLLQQKDLMTLLEREKNLEGTQKLKDMYFPDSKLTLEDYKNPDLIGYEEVTQDDGTVCVNLGEKLMYWFYNVDAQTGEVLSDGCAGGAKKTLNLDWFYEDEYGFNPGFDY